MVSDFENYHNHNTVHANRMTARLSSTIGRHHYRGSSSTAYVELVMSDVFFEECPVKNYYLLTTSLPWSEFTTHG